MLQVTLPQIHDIRPDLGDLEYLPVVNVSNQSILARAGRNALIIRPTTPELQLPPDTEFQRRIDATEQFRREVPAVVQPTKFITMQGLVSRNDEEGQLEPVLVRITPWFDQATPLSRCSRLDLIGKEYSNHLLQIHWFSLKQSFHGRVFDLGTASATDHRLPPVLNRLINALFRSNMIVGVDPETAKRTLFVDPDWYSVVEDPGVTPEWIRFHQRRMFLRSITAYTLWCINWRGTGLIPLLTRLQPRHI